MLCIHSKDNYYSGGAENSLECHGVRGNSEKENIKKKNNNTKPKPNQTTNILSLG